MNFDMFFATAKDRMDINAQVALQKSSLFVVPIEQTHKQNDTLDDTICGRHGCCALGKSGAACLAFKMG
jgi:hypothetical protein